MISASARPTKEITVVRAGDEDLKLAAELHRRDNEIITSKLIYGGLLRIDVPSSVQAITNSSEAWFVAKRDDGTVVGVSYTKPVYDLPRPKVLNAGYINIYVTPGYRGKGVTTNLRDHALEVARGEFNVIIREASNKTDFWEADRLYRIQYKEPEKDPHHPDHVRIRAPTEARSESWVNERVRMRARQTEAWFFAYVGDQVVAFASLKTKDQPDRTGGPALSDRSHKGIFGFYVHPEWRVQGIGSALLDTVIRQAGGRYELIEAETANEAVFIMFSSRHFKHTGTKFDDIKRVDKDGKPILDENGNPLYLHNYEFEFDLRSGQRSSDWEYRSMLKPKGMQHHS